VTCSKLCRNEHTRAENRRRYAENPEYRANNRRHSLKNAAKSNAQRRQKRREDGSVVERERRWREANREKLRAQKKARYAANPSKFLEQFRNWLLANPDKREKQREYRQQYYVRNLAKIRDDHAARYWAERPARLEKARRDKAELLAAVRAFRRLCDAQPESEPDQRTLKRREYGRANYAKNKAWISVRRQMRRAQNAEALRASERRHSDEQRAILRTFRDLALTQ